MTAVDLLVEYRLDHEARGCREEPDEGLARCGWCLDADVVLDTPESPRVLWLLAQYRANHTRADGTRCRTAWQQDLRCAFCQAVDVLADEHPALLVEVWQAHSVVGGARKRTRSA